MKKILVPIDFSECSVNASHYAINLANMIDANITLFNVYHMPLIEESLSIKDLYNELEKESNRKLNEFKKELKDDFGSTEIHIKSRFGLGVTEILGELEDNTYDLIVMGTTGASGLKETLLGSITSELIGNSTIPIMAIPKKVEYKKPEIFTLASDFKTISSANQLKFLVNLALSLSSEINILKVLEKNDSSLNDTEETQNNILDLEEALQGLKRSFLIIKSDDLETELLDRTKETENILTVIHRNRGFIDRIFSHSISKKLAMHTKSPILIFRS